MGFTREDVRAAVERAGEEHWQALVRHHEDPYPRPAPTPGDVCRAEAERLEALGIGRSPEARLLETRVRRIGETIELTHRYLLHPGESPRETEPFRNYAPDPAE